MSLSNTAILDLSSRPRLGFKGRGTLVAMQKRGMQLQAKPNQAFRQADGMICMVLAATEVFLVGHTEHAQTMADLETTLSSASEEWTYPLPRRHSHAWFALRGNESSAVFSKLCAVDLKPTRFANLSIAQTSVARLNSIVLRADLQSQPTYHWFADSACAVYMLKCLQDAADEFGGRVVDATLYPDPLLMGGT